MVFSLLACLSGPSAPGKTAEDTLEEPRDSAYCRSLDPEWLSRFTEPIDQQVATLIAREGLEGDPAVEVGLAGTCQKRPLPAITDPMAQLGRALFFSKDLSGDQDVACASCHHPALGGGDAISLSVGPTDRPDAMGADRVRGLSDEHQIFVPRNAPTTFNIAFWDRGLFWDERVESLDPEAGFNGDGAAMHTPDADSLEQAAAETGVNLTASQAWFPVAETHEMAGSWGTRYPNRQEIRDALAKRLAQDSGWAAQFQALCGTEGLPDSWQTACAAGQPITFANLAHAIGEYERSQIFTDSPWRAYVQGNPDAISEGAKKGALLFFQTVADGGQNCFACHRGDFFTDEDFHVIGTPQIGPGKDAGEDDGRGLLTSDGSNRYAFRTPTLLNVEVTAPYDHSGAYPTLAKTIGHYDNPNGRLFEYFGEGNKSDLNLRPWCGMTQFENIPECQSLYTIGHTAGGKVGDVLDPEVEGIKTLENNATVYLEAFLNTLTDPRVKDPAALADWIDPSSTLQVTETSSEWPLYCDSMIERAADMNLHNKGLRWLATGGIVDGGDVNTHENLYDTFGVHYWELFDTAFTANSGVEQDDRQLAIAMMEILTDSQRSLLEEAYVQIGVRGNHSRILELRIEIFGLMNALRNGSAVDEAEFRSRILEIGRLEAEDLYSMVAVYTAMQESLSPSELEAQKQTFLAISRGDLSSLPPGVYTAGLANLEASSARAAEVKAASKQGTLPWDGYAAGYLTWTLGWDCRFSFMSRMLDGDRRANYYGFSLWASNYLFDLNTGKAGSGDFELEMANYLAAQDAAAGLTVLFESTLTDTIEIRHQYDSARENLVKEMISAASEDPAAAQAAIRSANEAVAEQDLAMLLKELDYYLALQRAAGPALSAYVACIESPETQAMRGNGGFQALGGGSCEP